MCVDDRRQTKKMWKKIQSKCVCAGDLYMYVMRIEGNNYALYRCLLCTTFGSMAHHVVNRRTNEWERMYGWEHAIYALFLPTIWMLSVVNRFRSKNQMKSTNAKRDQQDRDANQRCVLHHFTIVDNRRYSVGQKIMHWRTTDCLNLDARDKCSVCPYVSEIYVYVSNAIKVMRCHFRLHALIIAPE